jgi:hypothetical protein
LQERLLNQILGAYMVATPPSEKTVQVLGEGAVDFAEGRGVTVRVSQHSPIDGALGRRCILRCWILPTRKSKSSYLHGRLHSRSCVRRNLCLSRDEPARFWSSQNSSEQAASEFGDAAGSRR